MIDDDDITADLMILRTITYMPYNNRFLQKPKDHQYKKKTPNKHQPTSNKPTNQTTRLMYTIGE